VKILAQEEVWEMGKDPGDVEDTDINARGCQGTLASGIWNR